jgi:hypothetical protein
MKLKKVRIILAIMGLCIASIPAVAQAAAPLVMTTSNCGALTVNATLKSDLTCPETIDINSANITLNLNGYTLDTAVNDVVDVNASGFTLTGGTISVNNENTHGVYANEGFSTLNISKVNFIDVCDCNTKGMYIERIARANISNTKFSNLMFGLLSVYSNVNLSNSTFDSNFDGFYSNSDNVVNITGSSFINNGRYGIRGENSASFNVSSSKADYNLDSGMYLVANRQGVVNINSSFAQNNLGNGIQVYESTLAGKTSSIINTVASGNYNGIYVQRPGSMTLKGNLANNNRNEGIYVFDNFGSNGPLTGSYNSANYNGAHGLYAEFPVAGTGNTATGNGFPAPPEWNCVGFVCKK